MMVFKGLLLCPFTKSLFCFWGVQDCFHEVFHIFYIILSSSLPSLVERVIFDEVNKKMNF